MVTQGQNQHQHHHHYNIIPHQRPRPQHERNDDDENDKDGIWGIKRPRPGRTQYPIMNQLHEKGDAPSSSSAASAAPPSIHWIASSQGGEHGDDDLDGMDIAEDDVVMHNSPSPKRLRRTIDASSASSSLSRNGLWVAGTGVSRHPNYEMQAPRPAVLDDPSVGMELASVSPSSIGMGWSADSSKRDTTTTTTTRSGTEWWKRPPRRTINTMTLPSTPRSTVPSGDDDDNSIGMDTAIAAAPATDAIITVTAAANCTGTTMTMMDARPAKAAGTMALCHVCQTSFPLQALPEVRDVMPRNAILNYFSPVARRGKPSDGVVGATAIVSAASAVASSASGGNGITNPLPLRHGMDTAHCACCDRAQCPDCRHECVACQKVFCTFCSLPRDYRCDNAGTTHGNGRPGRAPVVSMSSARTDDDHDMTFSGSGERSLINSSMVVREGIFCLDCSVAVE